MSNVVINGVEYRYFSPIENKFWSSVSDKDKNNCMKWLKGKYPNGYGRFNFNGHRIGAHRMAYILGVGSIDNGLVVHHTCNKKDCCNPEHLKAVTPKQNTRIHFNTN